MINNIQKISSYSSCYLLWTILLCGFIVRIGGIGEYSFNGDEMQFLIIAKGDSLKEVWRRGLAELHPPLDHFIRHYLLMISSDFFVQRLFSVLAGLISIVAIFKLGMLLRGKELAYFCAIFLAFSPIAVLTSTTFRNYAFFFPLMLFALCAFVRYQQQHLRKDLILFTGLIFLASATHFTGFLMSAALGIAEGIILLRSRNWRELLVFSVSFLPLFLLALFFYAFYLAPGTIGPIWKKLAIDANGDPNNFMEHFYYTLKMSIAYFFPFLGLNDWDWVIAHSLAIDLTFIAALALLVIYIIALCRMSHINPALALLITLAWIISIGVSLLGFYPLSPTRHSLYLLPLLILPYGYLLEPWLKRLRIDYLPWCIALLVTSILLALSGRYVIYNQEFTLKQNDLLAAQDYLKTHLEKNDAIVTGRIDAYFYLLYDWDAGKTPYDYYQDFPYYNQSVALAPYNPTYLAYTSHQFRDMLKARMQENSANAWFVMYGWKNIEIWDLMECASIQSKIHNFFSRDGVIIFSIKKADIRAFADNDIAWNDCFKDYKPLISGEPFKAVKR